MDDRMNQVNPSPFDAQRCEVRKYLGGTQRVAHNDPRRPEPSQGSENRFACLPGVRSIDAASGVVLKAFLLVHPDLVT